MIAKISYKKNSSKFVFFFKFHSEIEFIFSEFETNQESKKVLEPKISSYIKAMGEKEKEEERERERENSKKKLFFNLKDVKVHELKNLNR